MKEHLLSKKSVVEETDYETVEMTIDEAGMEILMHNLTNLYANPELAVLREYSSNALDSHQRAGQTAPIQIHLPTYQEPQLTIEDFGVGLSKAELRDVYSRYGASTKRDTNTQIGAFGLGAKSALAVSERFDIVATKDGVTTVAYVQKNARRVGQFYFVSEERTGAPSGVKITVPISRYSNLSRDSLRWFFLGWPEGSVDFLGASQPLATSVYNTRHFTPLKLSTTTVGWVATESGGLQTTADYSFFLNVGGVHYAARAAKVEDQLGAEQAIKLRALRNYKRAIVLNVPLGGVELTPSREDLIYSDLTIQTIVKLAENAIAVLASTVQLQLNALPNRKSALGRMFEEKEANFPALAQLTYRGQKIPAAFDADGWMRIVAKSRGEKAHIKFFKAGNLVSLRHVAAAEIGTYNEKGKRTSSRPITDFTARKAIRITNASPDEVLYAKSYLMKTFEQLRFPNRVVDAEIWFTRRGVRLDEWVEPLITETLSYEQFKAEVQAEKKRQRAEARRTAVATPGSKVKDAVAFGVIGNPRLNPRPYATTYHDLHFATPDQINALGKQVVLSHKELPHPFALGVFSNYTTSVPDTSGVLRFVHHYRPDVVVVGVPRAVGLGTLERRFPGHILLSEILRPEIERVVDTKTNSDVLAAAAERVRMRPSRAYQLAAYAKAMEPQLFAKIKSADTRAYLQALLVEEEEASEPTLDEQLYNEFARRESTYDTDIAKQALVWQQRAERYVMVSSSGYVSKNPTPEDLRHLVLYVNAVDTELAGDAL